jgi:hypothetical protein
MMPKYQIWWKSVTDHGAIIEAANIDEAHAIGQQALDDVDVELTAWDTEYVFVGVELLEKGSR